MKPAVLPVYYYHDHFRELLSFVRQTYNSLLTVEHYAFIAQFEELSKDSQCLFIRMVNRHGRIFRHKAFRYAEIADPERAVTELGQRGHVRPLHEEDYAAFLGCLRKML